MADTRFDAIIIGAGHNGLTAAATLAGKGKTVCVLERSDRIGGMSRSADLAGVSVPQIAHLLYNLSPAAMRDLGIGNGIPLRTIPLPTIALSPDGQHVVLGNGKLAFADGSAHPDAAAYMTLHSRLTSFAALLGRFSDGPPPALSGGIMDAATLRELSSLGKFGLSLKRLGKKDMREFLRIILSNAYDVILDEMADGPLAGALAADAVRGAYAGPRSPGTVFSLMYRMGKGGEAHLPVGGMAAVAGAFEAAARKRGVDIRIGVDITRLVVVGDRAEGVLLSDGTTIHADVVLSSAGALQTLKLAGVEHFDVEATRRIRNLRNKGTTAKVNLVLDKVPAFRGLTPEQASGRLLIAPSAAYVERAFNPAKYGEISREPVIEAVLPPAEGGKQALSAIVSYAPYALEGGWTSEARAALQAVTVGTLERYAPGLGSHITAADVLSPVDIEALTGAPGGHWHHAEMGIDQILTVRPVNLMSRYAFGVGGLYLCGASAHPGGDIMGAAGRNAALQALEDGAFR